MPEGAPDHGIRPIDYRLPESTHLGRVRLQVADLKRSIAFYEKVLGMRVIRRTPDSAGLGPYGEDREIVHLHQLASARPVPRRGLLGLYHFAILLPDRASLGRFVAHLAEIGESRRARALCEKLLSYASPLGLYAEEIDAGPHRIPRHAPDSKTEAGTS